MKPRWFSSESSHNKNQWDILLLEIRVGSGSFITLIAWFTFSSTPDRNEIPTATPMISMFWRYYSDLNNEITTIKFNAERCWVTGTHFRHFQTGKSLNNFWSRWIKILNMTKTFSWLSVKLFIRYLGAIITCLSPSTILIQRDRKWFQLLLVWK